MISTAVTDVDSPHAEAIFASAAHYGVRRIKLGYWPYEPFGTLARAARRGARRVGRLAELGRKYHVLPCVHCHSGRLLAAGGFGTYLILREFEPDEVGAYVDPMHMTIEGGVSGWEMGLDLLAPWVALVGIKNFRWLPGDRDELGQRRYRWEYAPWPTARPPCRSSWPSCAGSKYDGIVSLHSEYKGESSFRRLTTPQLLTQSAADLMYLKKIVASIGLRVHPS